MKIILFPFNCKKTNTAVTLYIQRFRIATLGEEREFLQQEAQCSREDSCNFQSAAVCPARRLDKVI